MKVETAPNVTRTRSQDPKPGAILASNTSTLDVDKIAQATKRPQDVLGLHFFSPANIMRLLEIVRGKATAKDTLATAMALSKILFCSSTPRPLLYTSTPPFWPPTASTRKRICSPNSSP